LFEKQPFAFEERIRRKDGQYRWFLAQFNPCWTNRAGSFASIQRQPTSMIVSRRKKKPATKTRLCENKSSMTRGLRKSLGLRSQCAK
jgi:hypothetical protein